MSWSNSRSSVFDRLNIVTCDPRPENTCPISTAMKPPPMMPSRFGSSGEPHDRVGGVEAGLHQSGDRWHDRAGTSREQDVRCGDATTLDVEGSLVDEVGRAFDQGDVRRAGGPIVAAARRDRVDQTEHPIADRGPVGTVELGVDAQLRRRLRRHRDVSWVDEHLRWDASPIETGPSEHVAFDDRDLQSSR